LLAICFSPSLADSFIFLTLTPLVVVFIFVNFSFALFTPPLGDYQRLLIKFEGASCGKVEKISKEVIALLDGQEYADPLVWEA
jgi:hypothetical protein